MAGAAAVLAASAARLSRRSRRVVRHAGPLKRLIGTVKSLFGKRRGQVLDAGASSPPPPPSSTPGSITVSSLQTLGQPFCGDYADQGQLINGRRVFRKMGLPEGSQDVYCLFNNAQQWAFTPHSDGRPDGWAFASDVADEPFGITGPFSVWDGSAWMPDPTLSISGSLPRAPPAVREAAAAQAQPEAVAEEAEAAPEPPAAAEKEAAAPAPAPVEQPALLPVEAAPLGELHWRSHWHEMTRCQSDWPPVPAHFSQRALPDHAGVKRGVLSNGLRYVMLQNAMPPQRFEAHIELHVGSIDEEPHEQGIAHMMEHVCFLGSRKRQGLVGTGSRSNALTDFQHTIYHIHAPNKLENGRDMFVPALGALNEIAFEPEMLNSRIEKERKAVLAEMQQVNDMEYRIETWTLSGLHETNKLGTQFPIGKEEQIKGWTKEDLKAFHEKWYYPGNATLYVVGDLSIEEMETGIRRVFQGAQARHKPAPDTAILEPVWGAESADARSLFRRKIARHRPEQLHNFGLPMIGTTGNFTAAACFDAAAGGEPWHGPLRIFRNELLEGLQLNFYSKAPVRPLRTQEDILYLVCARILIGVVQFRIVSRYSSNHAPVQIDHSDSFREGCAVTSITVNADTRDWRNALACVVQELRAVCDYGITDSEQKRYMEAMLKDVEKGVVENDTVPSEDHLNFIMTSDVFDHVVMHPDQSFQVYKEVAPYVTKEQIITTAKWMFGFLAYYGKAMAPPPTAIVVCTPTQVYEEQSDAWSPFTITEEEIVELLITVPDKSKEDALNQVDVPDSLMKQQLETLLAGQPVDAVTAWRATSRKVDEATGITQLMLPNGARVNYACTTNESQGTMRILVPGGRSAEEPGEICSAMVGIRTVSESGAVSDFARDQIELFAISNGMSVHLDLNLESSYVDSSFTLGDNGLVAVLELLHLLFTEPRWELPAFVRAQQAYKAQAYSVEKSMEKSTMDRLMKLMYRNNGRVAEPQVSDLNRLSMAIVRRAVNAQLRPQDFEINLVADFEGVTQHKVAEVEGAMSTGKHHREGQEQEADAVETQALAAAKERRLLELDEALWRYLGSVPPSEAEQAVVDRAPVIGRGEELAEQDRECSAHIEDSDERAVANLGGGAPNRWGKGDAHHSEVMAKKNFSWGTPNSPVKDHPLYPSMCLLAMREVVNTRLFSRVRDSLGLSYDCSFELSMLSRLEAGWYTCTVSSHPSRIREAVSAAKDVLQGVISRPISELEMSSARRTLLRRHETDLQSNEQWISLLSYLQSDAPKDISCVRDIETMLSKLTAADVQNAFLSLLTDRDQIFVSVTTAGPQSYAAGGAASAAAPQGAGATKQLVSLD